MLKTLTTVASVALPIEERWSIKRCRYAPDGESVGRVCIATGTHGDEMMGQLIVYLVQQRIAAHPDALRGTVDFYPMLNPLGLDIGERMVPSGTRLDMNRAFPGSPDGTPLEYMCYQVIQDMRGADFVLDLHASARNKSELYEVRVSAKEADRLLPRVRALCPQLIWVYPDKGSFSASLTGALAAEGVDAVILEADERRRLPQEIAAAVVDGIFCKLKEMGIWTATPSTRRAASGRHPYRIHARGRLPRGLRVPRRVCAGGPHRHARGRGTGARHGYRRAGRRGARNSQSPVRRAGVQPAQLFFRISRHADRQDQKGAGMKKDILFTLPSYFRDDMNIMAYRFGKGEKTCAVVGALRGDEVQQLYVCARLVSFLREVEKEDGVQPGKSVMIVPTVIGASMNEGSRLWEPENMDINRRFPGDVTGSTTERIAGALLDRLKNYRYGVQLTSFYQPGSFVPHVRMMDTGRQNPDLGCEFGLPYVYVRTPRSYDQTTLNYNWQLCGTQAYSLYAGKTREIDEAAADQTLRAIVRFLNSRGVIRSETAPGHPSTIITNADMISVSATSAGLLRRIKFAGAHVRRGEQLAFIINPCDGSVREVLKAPVTGMLFFMQDGPFITEHSPVFQVLAGA